MLDRKYVDESLDNIHQHICAEVVRSVVNELKQLGIHVSSATAEKLETVLLERLVATVKLEIL